MDYLAHTLVSPHVHSGESYVDLLVIFTIILVALVASYAVRATKKSGEK